MSTRSMKASNGATPSRSCNPGAFSVRRRRAALHKATPRGELYCRFLRWLPRLPDLRDCGGKVSCWRDRALRDASVIDQPAYWAADIAGDGGFTARSFDRLRGSAWYKCQPHRRRCGHTHLARRRRIGDMASYRADLPRQIRCSDQYARPLTYQSQEGEKYLIGLWAMPIKS